MDDVDGDGDLDLVTAGNDDEFGVLLGDGAGGFTVTTVPNGVDCELPASCSSPRVRQVVDVNEDGHPDVVVTYEYDLSVPPPDGRSYEATAVRFGDGSGGFGPRRQILVPPEEAATNGGDRPRVLADATGDGVVDGIIFADGGQSAITVRPGDGTGAFGPATVSPVPGHRLPTSLHTADIDADGSTDLVMDGACVSGSSGSESWITGCIDVMRGDSSGEFADPVRLTVADPEIDGLSATIGDVNGDGNLDLIGAGWGSSFDGGGPVGSISLFFGDGEGGFGPEVPVGSTVQTSAVLVADLDLDGHADLLTATEDGDADPDDDFGRVRFGDGSGHFSGTRVIANGPGLIADLDADGKPDYATTASGEVQVFMNRWDGRPT